MEPEAIRPRCWFGRRCPLKMAQRYPEVLRAYEFAMKAVSRHEHKGERAGEVEYSTERSAIKFACWAFGLKARDRLRAIALVEVVVMGARIGADWVTERRLAKVMVGTPHETPDHQLVLSLDEPDPDDEDFDG